MGTLNKDVINNMRSAQGKPVRLIMSEKNWLETQALDQLVKTTDLDGICCGIGMPDLHPGKGQPIGAAFISKETIYPHLVGSDIGCGMGLWQLDVKPKKVDVNKWDKKLKGLDHKLSESELSVYYNALNLPDSYAQHNTHLGTIGGGNHFAEIQQIASVYDSNALEQLGLHKTSVVLLVHSGSRGLGQRILQEHVDQYSSQGLSLGTKEADEYLEKHHLANHWAVINRLAIADRFIHSLSLKAEPLLDISHNHVQRLSNEAVSLCAYEWSETGYWIHRKGASPTDQGPVMIPGSRGSLSYLVRPKDNSHALETAGFSLAHGAGRKWKRSDAKGRLHKRYDLSAVLQTPFESRVICANKNLAYEESQLAYKNIDTVIADLVAANVIDVLASFKPLLTYKTRKAQ